MKEHRPHSGNEHGNSSPARTLWKGTRRLVVSVIGGTVILLGIALLVLPGPGLAVIALGIAILALEFAWARRVLREGKGTVGKLRDRFGSRKARDKGKE